MSQAEAALAPIGRWSASFFLMQSVSGMSAFVFLVLTARFLGPGPRGVVALFAVSALLWVTLGTIGTNHATLHFVGRGASPGALIDSFRGLLIGGTVVAVVGAAITFPLVTEAPRDARWTVLVVSGVLVVRVATLLSSAALGLGQFVLVATARVLSSVVSIVVLIGLQAFGVLTAFWAACVWSGMWALNAAVLAGGIRVPAEQGVEGNASTARRISFALRSFPSAIGEELGARLDQWLVGILSTVASAGVYSVALGLSEVVLLPGQALGASLFAAASRDELQPSFPRRPFLISLLLSGLAALVLAANAWWMVPLVFGDAYKGAVVPAIIITLAAVAFGVQRALGPYMAGRGRPGYYSLASVTTALVLAVGVILMLPPFGLVGAASGSAIGYVAGGVVALTIAARLKSVTRTRGSHTNLLGEE